MTWKLLKGSIYDRLKMNSVFIWLSLPEESNEDDTEKGKIHIVDKSYRDGVVGNCTTLLSLDSSKLLSLCIG